MEAAIAIAAIVLVVVLCLGAALATSVHIRCVDAAREAARLAARGDAQNARTAAARVAPDGARIEIKVAGDHVVAVVSAQAGLLPLDLHAEAVAALEPGPE